MSALADVRTGIDAEDWPGALAHAISAWRKRRIPELADLVDAIAARRPPTAIPHTKQRFAAWWMQHALVYDPVTAGTLVAHADERMFANEVTAAALAARWPMGNAVVAALVGASWHAWERPRLPLQNWLDRFSALVAWPDDPRVARVYTRWIVEGKTLDLAPPSVVRLVAERLGALGDARALPVLRAAIGEPRGASPGAQALSLELARLALTRIGQARDRDPPPGLVDEARALAARCASAVASAAPAPVVDDLWRQVADAPDDRALRLVLADALVQRGDSRGELILLQSTGSDARTLARVNRLIKEGWVRWLGDLALVLTRRGSDFEGGLLGTVRVGQTSTPTWAWGKVWRHHELGGVHTVRANHVSATDFARFVLGLRRFPSTLELNAPEQLDAIARSLPVLPLRAFIYAQRTVGHVRTQWPPLQETFETLARHAPTLEHIALPSIWPWHARAQVRDLVPLLPRMFPRLTKIRLAPTTLTGIHNDPDALERTRTLPLVELYDPSD